eukprot:8765714-Pyramimonas_sp.AAC.1
MDTLLELLLVDSGAVRRTSTAVLGPSWVVLEPSWRPLGGPVCRSWGASWGALGRREAEKARTPESLKVQKGKAFILP